MSTGGRYAWFLFFFRSFFPTNVASARAVNKSVNRLGACFLPGEGGVLLGIHGGGVPPGSPNPDPIADQKIAIFYTPGL